MEPKLLTEHAQRHAGKCEKEVGNKKAGLNAISTTDLFDAFTKTLCVENDNVMLGFDFIGGSLGSCSALVLI